MPFAYKEMPENKTIELSLTGKLTKEDFQEITNRMQTFMKEQGKIKLLENLMDFNGSDIALFGDAMAFDFRNLKNYSRCAIVQNKPWMGPFAKIATAFSFCETRLFKKIEDAQEWIQEDLRK